MTIRSNTRIRNNGTLVGSADQLNLIPGANVSIVATPMDPRDVDVTISALADFWVNVKATPYNAVGDGVTDDTAAFQAALATGKNVIGVFGDAYKITSGLVLSTLRQTLDLQGATLKPVGTFTALTVSQSQVNLRRARIDASGLTGKVLVTTSEVNHFLFEKLRIEQPSDTAIELVDPYTGWLRDVLVSQASARSFLAYSSISGTPVNSLRMENCSFEASTYTGDVVAFETGAGIYIDKCDWQNNDGAGSTDLRIASTVNAGVTGITISKAYFENGINKTGNSIFIGTPGSGVNTHGNVLIEDSYFQTSKQPINIGTLVDADTLIAFSEFVTVTGAPADPLTASGSTRPGVFQCKSSFGTPLLGVAVGADGALEIDGALNHDGATVGFYGVTPAARPAAYTPTNVTADRSYDANATTTDELADVLGTLIADLQSLGLVQ